MNLKPLVSFHQRTVNRKGPDILSSHRFVEGVLGTKSIYQAPLSSPQSTLWYFKVPKLLYVLIPDAGDKHPLATFWDFFIKMTFSVSDSIKNRTRRRFQAVYAQFDV